MILSQEELNTVPRDEKSCRLTVDLIMEHEDLGRSCALRVFSKSKRQHDYNYNQVMMQRLLEGSHCRFKFSYQLIRNQQIKNIKNKPFKIMHIHV